MDGEFYLKIKVGFFNVVYKFEFFGSCKIGWFCGCEDMSVFLSREFLFF